MNEEKKYLFILFSLSFVFFFARIWEPYLSGDDLKYVLTAKEIIFTKDWLNLSLCYEPYLKKPPFYFWLIAISYKIFGISVFSARFFPALFGIFNAFLIYIIGKEIFKEKIYALIAAIFFVINLHVLRLTTIVRMESIITFFIFLNFYLLMKGRKKKLYFIFSGIPLGLGILTKGPLAFLGILSFLILHLLKRDFKFVCWQFLSGLFIAVFICFPWYIYQWIENKAFFTEFFGHQIGGRITGTLPDGTKQNLFFYFWKLIVYFIPGLPFFIMGIYFFFKKKVFIENNWWKVIFVYIIFVFIIINIPKEKFTHYLYYLYPSFALFCALALKELNGGKVFVKIIYFVTPLYLLVALIYPHPYHHPFHQGKIENYQYHSICKVIKNANTNIKTEGLSELENCYFYFYCVKDLNKKPSVLISKKERKKSIYSQDGLFMYKISNSTE
jgi:4-amino-4-deoxy-L-arabinose transferase-like glycosyltransferase